MDENKDITPADEKALAMYYAYASLVRALCLNGSLSSDQLYQQLAGSNQRLHELGETGAAAYLGQIAQSLQAIDE